MANPSFNRRQMLRVGVAGCAGLAASHLVAQDADVPADLQEMGIDANYLRQMRPLIEQSPSLCHDVLPTNAHDLLKSIRNGKIVNGEDVPRGDEEAGLTLKSLGVSEANADKPPGRSAQAIASKSKKWPKSQPVTWGIVTPNNSEAGRIRGHLERAFAEWKEVTCLDFEYLNNARGADIRISLIPNRGHYSLLGTDSRLARTNPRIFGNSLTNLGESLNITPNPNTRDSEYYRVALHELGHALGLLHEQFHMASPIQWDRQAVYSHFWITHKWPVEVTNANVFQNPNIYEVQMTAERDRNSIMHYWFPQHLHRNGDSVPSQPNNVLSETDKAFMRRYYDCPQGAVNKEPAKPGEKDPQLGDKDPPSKINNKPTEAATPVEPEKAVNSSIREAGDIRSFEIKIVSGDKYAIETIEFPATPVKLKLYESKTLNRVLEVASFNGKHLLNARITTELTQGSHYLSVEHVNRTESSIGEFTLLVKRA